MTNTKNAYIPFIQIHLLFFHFTPLLYDLVYPSFIIFFFHLRVSCIHYRHQALNICYRLNVYSSPTNLYVEALTIQYDSIWREVGLLGEKYV